MSEHEVRYIVGHGWAERVSDATALPHRVLRIGRDGDVTVLRSSSAAAPRVLLQIGHDELAFLAREARRAARARFWARLIGRR